MATDAPVTPAASRPLPIWVWLPVGLAVALGVGFGAWFATRPRNTTPSPFGASSLNAGPQTTGLPRLTGQVAPGFHLPSLRGGSPVALAAHQPTVLNFFASWCHGCRQEIDAFGATWKADRGKVAFVGVDTGETSPATARKMLAQAGATYPVGLDASSTVTGRYQILALPTTIFIDRSGRVAGEVFGPQTRQDLARWIHKLGA